MDGVPVKTCDEMFHDLLESGVTEEEELYATGEESGSCTA
jgi:hypothetical protein